MQAIRPGLERVKSEFPGVIIDEGGRQRQLFPGFASLPIGFLAATIGIYMILCLLFASMRQPIAVLASIPFGIIGVVLGHLLTGYNLTFLSLVGFIALSGIVVNDSLVLVEFFNRKKAEGVETVEGVDGGRSTAFATYFVDNAHDGVGASSPHAGAIFPGEVPHPDGHFHLVWPYQRDGFDPCGAARPAGSLRHVPPRALHPLRFRNASTSPPFLWPQVLLSVRPWWSAIFGKVSNVSPSRLITLMENASRCRTPLIGLRGNSKTIGTGSRLTWVLKLPKIFAFHLGLLRDPALQEAILNRIRDNLDDAAHATAESILDLSRRFQALNDPIFREKGRRPPRFGTTAASKARCTW